VTGPVAELAADLVDLRSELGVPKDQTLVGFVARMTTQKDPLTMVEAIERVAAQAEDIHFLLVGDGGLRGEAEARVKAHGLEKRVTFTGFRQAVPNVLHTLDVYVLPSLWEGLPNAALEGCACGLPALLSRAANLDGIIDERCGIEVPTADRPALTRALARLLALPEATLRAMGQRARARVVERFDADSALEQTLVCYDRALARGRSSGILQ